jgi:hypothetical protein
MTELYKYFENIFQDPKITPQRLEEFTDDHLERLIANNTGGIYDAIILATTTKRDTFHNTVVVKGSETSQRIGSTVTKETMKKGFITFMRVKSNFIADKFGKPSAGYSAFYPYGLTTWNHATDQGLTDMADEAVEAATTHQGVLGLQFLTDITAMRDAYVNAESGQTSEKGDVANARAAELMAEHDLQIQLTINVHTIAIENSDGPAQEIANTFFEESLLFGHQFRHYFKSTVAAQTEKEVCKFTYHATNHFTFEHHSAKPLTWQMTLAGVKVGNTFTTSIGQKLHLAYNEFAADGDALVVTNAEDIEGIYRVIQIS